MGRMPSALGLLISASRKSPHASGTWKIFPPEDTHAHSAAKPNMAASAFLRSDVQQTVSVASGCTAKATATKKAASGLTPQRSRKCHKKRTAAMWYSKVMKRTPVAQFFQPSHLEKTS